MANRTSHALDEAPISAPAPMSRAEARHIARRLFGPLGAIDGDPSTVCLVGRRQRRHVRGLHKITGRGDTWEAAFHVALSEVGR